ncbi:MAG: hypothetical protein RL637_948 [Pseudomonadota bacterium]|jgi:pyrroloquinoline quinone biosynthesis protein D
MVLLSEKIMQLDSELPLCLTPGHRLQWEAAQQKYVILYPEGMVELNLSSAEIIKACDGQRRVADIIQYLEQLFNAQNLTNDITHFLYIALQNGWIKHC